MILFASLLGVDGVIGLILLYFFAAGVSDGSVSSFNIMIWLVMLGGATAILGCGLVLKARGKPRLANAALLILAGPGLLFALFFLSLIIFQPNWH